MKKRVWIWLMVLLMVVSILAVPVTASETGEEENYGATTLEENGSSGDGGSQGGDDSSEDDRDGSEGGDDSSEDDRDGSEGGDDSSEDDSDGSEGGSDGSEDDGDDSQGGNDGSEDDGDGSQGGNDGSEDDGDSSEGGSGSSGENGDSDDETTGDPDCTHAWIYVEVKPTCTEYGAKGYGCGICGAVKDIVVIDMVSHSYDNSCDDDCNVCNATREIEHKFSTQWSKNSSNHWHACSVCGEKSDVGYHYPGPAATEEKAQYCLTCGLMMMPKKNHTHTYAKEYSSDESGHWYACSGCDEKKDFQMHTYDTLCDPDCNDCGYHTETAHSFGESWNSDTTGHWQVCVLCQEKGKVQSHVPGAEATDLAAQLCSVCNFELVPAQDHVHEANAQWESDDMGHWKTCACGEKLEEAAHAWDSGTEREEDTVTYVCTECGAEKTEEVEKKATSGSFLWVVLIVLFVLMIGAAIALVVVLFGGKKKGKYHR